jgi:hypothetical protein
MKQEIKLNRTDDRPIAFMGEEIINETTKDRDATRWYTARVFKTDDGFMVGIAHITCWKGERDQYWADEARTRRDIIEILEAHAPTDSESSVRNLKEYLQLVDRVAKLVEPSGQAKKAKVSHT